MSEDTLKAMVEKVWLCPYTTEQTLADNGVEYIRADVHKATVAENERLRAALAMSDQALKQKQISEVQSTLPATIFETHPLPWRAVSDDHCYQDLVAANNALIIHNSSFCPVIAIDLSQIAAIANALISKEDA